MSEHSHIDYMDSAPSSSRLVNESSVNNTSSVTFDLKVLLLKSLIVTKVWPSLEDCGMAPVVMSCWKHGHPPSAVQTKCHLHYCPSVKLSIQLDIFLCYYQQISFRHVVFFFLITAHRNKKHSSVACFWFLFCWFIPSLMLRSHLFTDSCKWKRPWVPYRLHICTNIFNRH